MAYVIDPTKCSHPAQVRGKDGKMMCLVCGGEVKPRKPAKKAEDKKAEDKKSEQDKTEE